MRRDDAWLLHMQLAARNTVTTVLAGSAASGPNIAVIGDSLRRFVTAYGLGRCQKIELVRAGRKTTGSRPHHRAVRFQCIFAIRKRLIILCYGCSSTKALCGAHGSGHGPCRRRRAIDFAAGIEQQHQTARKESGITAFCPWRLGDEANHGGSGFLPARKAHPSVVCLI